MVGRSYETPCGVIRYWVGGQVDNDGLTLVFLPGLTADHRLFDKQIAFLVRNIMYSSGTPPATPRPGPSGWSFPCWTRPGGWRGY